MGSILDFGTARFFESPDGYEVSVPKFEDDTRAKLKELKGRWDPNRKNWNISCSRCNLSKDNISSLISEFYKERADQKWLDILPKLLKINTVTRRFSLNFGFGGGRIEFPEGYKHKWTLKGLAKSNPIVFERTHWLLPFNLCMQKVCSDIFRDILNDDRNLYLKSNEYLYGFEIEGNLFFYDFPNENIHDYNLSEGSIIFVNYSFLKAADKTIPDEPVHFWPMKVLKVQIGEEGSLFMKASFLDAEEAWVVSRHRLSSISNFDSKILDGKFIKEKWRRRRAS